MGMTVFVIIVVAIAAAFGVQRWSRWRTRRRLLASQLSGHQRAIVEDQVPLIARLPTDLHDKLEGKVLLFLHQVEFIGCNGLEVTEEMELSIAAQACLLIVNNDSWYAHLRTVLIYPGAFKSRQRESNGFVVTEREVVRTGESWARGPVILSWAHSERGASNDMDGHNVVLHEFAHQLDDLSGHTNGVPVLSEGQSFSDWAQAIGPAYDTHVESVRSGRKTFIDPYGAEGPEEFFAVAVEAFFEKPVELKEAEPKVYAQLAALFRLEPTDWGLSDV